MAYADRVKDVTTSTGTGAVTLSGTPPTTYRALSAVGTTGTIFDYCMTNTTDYEIGVGTITGTNTFSRSVVVSSNGNAAVSFAAGADFFVTIGAAALSRINKGTMSITTPASAGLPAINTDQCSVYRITALAADITSFTTNLTGAPGEGDELTIEVQSTAIRNLAWGTKFESSTIVLPSATVANQLLTISLKYNTVTAKWRCIGVA